MKILARLGFRVVRMMAWSLLIVGGFWLMIAVAASFDTKPDSFRVVLGGIALGSIFGLPGVVLLRYSTRSEAESRFRDQVLGLLRTHDRFTPQEVAQRIGRTPLETETLIWELNLEHSLDLIYHRHSESYIHRNRLEQGTRVIDHCQACGGHFKSELIFPGEDAACQFCGKSL